MNDPIAPSEFSTRGGTAMFHNTKTFCRTLLLAGAVAVLTAGVATAAPRGGGFRGVFQRGIAPRFNRGMMGPRFNRGIFASRFNRGMFDSRFNRGMFDSRFNRGMFDSRFNRGMFDSRFDPRFN